jgi:hypothetical protein
MTGFMSKTPPVKVVVDKDYFNMLIQVLVTTEKIEVDEKEKNRVRKLKEKILTYSVPKEEDGTTLIDIRFFVNEASTLISKLMFLFESRIEIEADYYSVLEKVRTAKNQTNE